MPRCPLGSILAGLALALLTACGTEPYRVGAQQGVKIAPPAEGTEVVARGRFDFDPTPWAFGLCYSELQNSTAELMAKAREVCPHGQIQSWDEDVFWNGCAILQPRRATFICYPEPGPEPTPDA